MKKFLVISLIVILVLSAGAVVALKVLNDSHEHNYGEWETKTPATCTEAEVEVRKCSCGDEQTREGDAPLGHSYTPVITAPTCTEAGYTTYTCHCGHSYKDDEVAATGHSFVNEVAEEKYLATNECGKQPTYYKSCSCGEKGSETFAYGEVNGHVYSSVVTAPTCTEVGYTTYTCTCGDSYVGDETKAIGHNMVTVSDDTHHWTACDREGCDEVTEKISHLAASISATSKLEAPMERTTVKASDLTVTATCQCGHCFAISEGIELENATLVRGENTITVKYGDLSTTVSIMAEKFNLTIGGTVTDDTYVSSANASSKDKDNSSATELKALSSSFRVYFRVNLKDALKNEAFNANDAKVQLVLTIINAGTNTNDHFDADGAVMDSIYTLKAYRNTDIAFSEVTWNGVSDTDLHWTNGSGSILVSDVANVGVNVTVADGKIIFTVAYGQLAEFIDEDGNLLLAFASPNTKSLSVNSVEAADETLRPVCNIVINDDHLHVFSEWETKTPATCTEKEVQIRKCSCGEEETREGAALGHDMQTKYDESYHWTECDREGCDEATDKIAHSGGTATETEKAICDTCGQSYGDFADHVHAYGDWKTKTPATCTKAEVEERKCACGAAETRDGDAALGHDIVPDAAVPETCTSTGLTAGEHCSRCDYKIAQKVTEMLSHTPGAEATCTSVQECTVCHTVLNPKLAHDYKATVTAPTCEVAGYTTYTCACGDSYIGDEKAATGHSYGDWETKTPATCTKAEVEIRKCSCGKEETRAGDSAFGHDMKTKYDESYHWTECDREGCDEATDKIAHSGGTATETEKAVCTTCGQSYGDFADHVHVYSEWITLTPATCTKAEVEEKKCACGAAETRDGDAALGHDIVPDAAVPATCTSTGLTAGEHCTRCDYVKAQEVTDMLSHTPGAEATCTTNQECTVCHTELYPMLGHKIENDPAKAATCTETGLTEGEHCTRCDYVKAQEVTDMRPHIPGLAATCTTNQECTVCHNELHPELGHEMVDAYDSTYHWTKCDREGCFETTERVAHTAVSISAKSNIADPVATMVVKASDLIVTGKCDCGADFALTDGIELANATLVLGNNTVTVKYGDLSTTVSIDAAELDLTIGGTVSDDTNVSSANSSSKGEDNSSATELKALSSSFRVYFRVNLKDALNNELFNPNYAKVQLILTFVNKGTDNNSYVDANGNSVGKIYTLKAYKDSAVDFSKITWNSVNNKEGSVGDYSDLNWNNGYGLVSNVDGVNVTVADGKVIITFAYSEISELVDKDGNIILAFASPNTKNISVGSLETEDKKPEVKVLLNEDYVHVFDREVVADKYFASANCTETAKYYKSCSCGEMCFITFDHGEVIEHQYGDWESDESNHWKSCSCGDVIDKGSHSGGTATETEKAKCEICGQAYGELKNEEPTEVTIAGKIKDDTYINSDTANNQYQKVSMGTYSSSFKIYFIFNLSEAVNAMSEDEKLTAKVQFSFAITDGSATETTRFTLKSFTTSETLSGLDFSQNLITWENVKEGGDYYALNWGTKGNTLVEATQGENIQVVNKTIKITLNFSDIQKYIDANGNIVLAFATNTSGLKIASMENETYDIPAVSVTYTK